MKVLLPLARGAIASALAALALALPSAPAHAQTAAPGWRLSPAPSLGGSLRELSDGTYLRWTGSTLTRVDAAGVVLTTFATFDPPVWTGVLGVAPDESFAIVGETSTGFVHRLDLPSGPLTPLAKVDYNYAVTIAPDGRVFLSAAASSLSNNDIVELDAVTGVATKIGSVPGASGPIAYGPDGRLWYATASTSWPTPLGSQSVVFWFQSDVDAGGPLTLSNAVAWMTQIDGAASLVVDPETGRAFVAESNPAPGYVSRIREVWPFAKPPLFSAPPGAWLTFGDLVSTPGDSIFAPYQPDAAARLRVSWNDFAGNSGVRHLSPARPSAAFSGPGTTGPGEVLFALDGAAPAGFALLAIGPAGLAPTIEAPIFGFGDAPLFVGLDLATMDILPGFYPLGPAGELAFSFFNPGGLEGWFAGQVIVLDQDFKLTATSNVALF
jgi:hypothetical protein